MHFAPTALSPAEEALRAEVREFLAAEEALAAGAPIGAHFVADRQDDGADALWPHVSTGLVGA